MSKRNMLIGCKQLTDKTILLHTLHYSVEVTFKEEMFKEKKVSGSQRIDCYISFDYNVTSRTTYATKYQLKKFLQRFFVSAIKDSINRHKEQNNG